MQNNLRRVLALLLCAVLLLTILPAAAAADDRVEHTRPSDLPDRDKLREREELRKAEEKGVPQSALRNPSSEPVRSTVDETPLQLGENTFVIPEATEDDSDNTVYRPFTAPEDGYYCFTSTSDDDTYAYLTDSEMNQITYNDDSGSGYNFRIVYEMSEGQTCYLGVRFYSYYDGEIPVTISTVDPYQCGDNLFWSYDDTTGTLTVAGTGDMWEFDWSSMPWVDFREDIQTVTLQEGVTSVGSHAFCEFYNLHKVNLPDSLQRIADNAFAYSNSLSSATLPKNLLIIEYYAFCGCGLTTVTIPASVEWIGEAAFAQNYDQDSGTPSLTATSFKIASGNKNYIIKNCALLSSDETRLLMYFASNTATSYTVPTKVTSIDPYAFYDCQKLTTVKLPDGLEYIPHECFAFCQKLKTINLPSKIRWIGSDAFYVCENLKSITLPNQLEEINSNAFAYSGLTSIKIPATVTYIGEGIFLGCWDLDPEKSSVAAGNSYCYFDDGVLFKDSGSTLSCYLPMNTRRVYRIPESVSALDYRAFYGCSNLVAVSIPEGFTWIGGYTFAYCTSLQSVAFPSTLNYIYAYAFDNTSIEDAYFLGDSSIVFYVYYNNGSLTTAETWHYADEAPFVVSGEPELDWEDSDVQYKGSTAYVIANGKAQTPEFALFDDDGKVINPAFYTEEYRENKNAGTGYVFVTFNDAFVDVEDTRGAFKIYLPATTSTTVENVSNGIKLTWKKVTGAAGYVIYRRAWNKTATGWTPFVRWNNTTDLSWVDKTVYPGTRYQYGVKAYFERRTDPVAGVEIGGNVGDNYNLGEVGPLKTTVRITNIALKSVTAGKKQLTVKWTANTAFSGYQIRIATDSAFTKNVKTVKVTSPKTTSNVIKSLKSGTTYYVQIRAYHVFNGTTYYGGWSASKTCKVK